MSGVISKTTKLSGFFLTWGPTLLLMGSIFIFSSLPGDQAKAVVTQVVGTTESKPIQSIPQLIIDWYKVGHGIGYFLLGASTAYAVRRTGNKILFPALSICFLYAITDEVHQIFTPNRNGRPADVLLDTLAALLAIWLFLKLAQNKQHMVK